MCGSFVRFSHRKYFVLYLRCTMKSDELCFEHVSHGKVCVMNGDGWHMWSAGLPIFSAA
jgi:hypothetical protein